MLVISCVCDNGSYIILPLYTLKRLNMLVIGQKSLFIQYICELKLFKISKILWSLDHHYYHDGKVQLNPNIAWTHFNWNDYNNT